ncbi:relaxase/mobilization nuclease domain-containing protein [Spirosoma flavum]|uniref:Relaxase/mobilization nuclease domain-containing protein n=1 Tax=Spirosoma flavum TaxID=2048557 RepID=A0ABW6AT13_9BACT
MIAKTTTGRSFDSALGYGAADLTVQQRQHKQPKVALLDSYNLISYSWQGMAAEMAAVAQGSRCTTPVWHTSLSAQPGEQLSADQWRAAARQYCTAMGADPAQHQVAIFQHHDTAHAHVHIYINRVRLDDGPALDTSHNYARNVKTTRQIEQDLALRALPEQRTSLRDHSGQTQANRAAIAAVLTQVLATQKPTSLAELTADLTGQGITTQLATNSQGIYGISFRQGNGQPVKGSAVGYKYRQLVTQLEANRAEYQAEIERLKHELEQKPAVVEIPEPDAGQQAEINRLRHERDEAYAKRNAMQEALLNHRPKTIIHEVEIIKEVIQSDPADQTQIEQLKQQLQRTYQAYVQQKEKAEKLPDLVDTLVDLRQQYDGLAAQLGQLQLALEQERLRYREMSEKWAAHIEKYSGLVDRYNALKESRQAQAPTPSISPVVAPASPASRPDVDGSKGVDKDWVASMRYRLRLAAQESGNWAQFTSQLQSASQTKPPITRRKGTDGQFIYSDKNGQATAAELGFKRGELRQLIEAPIQRKKEGPSQRQ